MNIDSYNARRKTASRTIKAFFPGLSYVDGSTVLHRAHPLVKLVLLLSFSFTVFALSPFLSSVILFVLLMTGYGLAGLGLTFFSRKLRFIFIFGFIIFLVQVFSVREGFLFWTVSLGKIHLDVWSEGFWGGLSMMMRFVNVIGSSYLFVATTDPNRLAYALMQVGLPYRLGFMLITALRFIPLFHMELAQVRNAQMAKGIELEGVSPGKMIKYVRYLLVPLVISALSKVDLLAISMESRAFGLYPTRSYMETQVLSPKDRFLLPAIPVLFAAFYCLFRR